MPKEVLATHRCIAKRQISERATNPQLGFEFGDKQAPEKAKRAAWKPTDTELLAQPTNRMTILRNTILTWKISRAQEREPSLKIKRNRKLIFFAFILHGLFLAVLIHGLLLEIAPAYAQIPRLPLGDRSGLETTFAKTPESEEASEEKNAEGESSKEESFESAIADTEKLKGLFTLYHNKETNQIFAEIDPKQLDKNFLCSVTMESGIGERGIYSGMPVGDYLFYFRRVNKNLHFVIRNVNFRTSPDDPQSRSLQRSFSDSILYSLKIKSIHPQRKTLLVDLGDLFLKDFPALTQLFKSMLGAAYQIDDNKTYFSNANAFPLNVEIESLYSFSSPGGEVEAYIPSVPDSRAFTLRVHYSLSEVSQNNAYRPRLADDRIGYFITTYKDFSDDNRTEPFVRYVNRWHLEKQNPAEPLSAPKQPLVFWIDNAVPLDYRPAIREGVLMWNKAFEKAGFQNAIEVRQMPDDADWNPADVRYNTIRWMNSLDGYFALGPSRVNPLTGEILDADIIVDANFVRAIKREFGSLVQQSQPGASSLFSYLGGESNFCTYNTISRYLPSSNDTANDNRSVPGRNLLSRLMHNYDLCFGMQSADQFAVGAMSLSLMNNIPADSPQMKEYVRQFLRALIAHEVGHTLGLRHNFHGSTMLMPQELHDTTITRTRGLVSSVMDYFPVNLAPIGVTQGDYYPSTIGPYDEWAITYGYQPVPEATTPQDELPFLETIAQRAPQPELAYATDEDVWFDDINPYAHPFDLSGDTLLYAQQQMDNARLMWERLEKRYPAKDESFSELRELFNTVFNYYFQQAYFVTQYVGGQSFTRNHQDDPYRKPPFVPVPAAKQRQALATLQTYVFNDDAFRFSPKLLNNLGPSRWVHWGNANAPIFRLDYPIYENISLLQRVALRALMSPARLGRLRDAELKAEPGQMLTLPELFDTLHQGVWTEVVGSAIAAVPQISSLRRSLQREHLDILTEMVLRQSAAPEDARTLARYKLRQLRDAVDKTLTQGGISDTYTLAHLEEVRDRIAKTLDAQLQTR